MKVGKLKEKETEELEKPRETDADAKKGENFEVEEKPKQNGKRVSRNISIDDDVYIKNPKQRKINDDEEEIVLEGLFDDDEDRKIEEDDDEEIKKKILKQLFSKNEVQDIDENDIAYYDLDEDLINMDDEDDGCGIVNNYVRGSPSSTVGIPRGEDLKSKLESYANLAIHAYNEVKSKEYRFVDVVSSTGYLCQGVLYSMTFEAKLSGQDDSDALTLVAEVYEGLFGEREVCLVCKPEERPPYYPQNR
ncbi:PREDICTED: uncharacterized protein LOC105951061 isoform X2 [Erythranthe guttata]|uniref:uncharacterized protein LOC105951061 isoform X2 n=1 Tax=Erythranthe guttata TaxID=4155 RepID=UPI00064D8514|nr:PREDICTED: uncharacterized protein LOC105951061 isoform X2 [Erythranthe guttata]|eukprot:XP_012829908.1 PREDICTED: uncharacterized protein LOC105951061 isoform X2 [Erythranthe guttata]